jgi:anti-sigma B factor antagonist
VNGVYLLAGVSHCCLASETPTPPSGQVVAELMHDPEETPAARQSEPPGQLTVLVRHEPDAAFVTIAGEVDLLSAPRLAATLDEIVETNARHIVIDLTETTFMDSAGIHTLVQTHQRARRHVTVVCSPGTVLRTLELLGLTEPLNVVSSLEECNKRRSGS